MTIRRGEEWGRAATVSAARLMVGSDAELAASSGHVVSVVAGDVHRALGCPPLPPDGARCTELQIDLLECTVSIRGGVRTLPASSSVVVGRWISRRRLICVSNAGWWGRWNVAPRAHPNDGVADIVVIGSDMAFVQRMIARQRARHGLHVPHPQVSVSTAREWATNRSGRREVLRIDGRRVRGWISVSVRVDPDRLTVQV